MNKFYITTPIYYVNASPHLGHAYTGVFADVIARYRRTKGDDVFFLTGTDEHGAKVMRAAEAAGVKVETFVDRQQEKFRNLAKDLMITHDDFIRTSDKKKHWPGAQKMWETLRKAGDIYLGKYEGQYCVGHEAFITDKDLENGTCIEHGVAPEHLVEENYFFRLSEYADRIRANIISGKFQILPEARKNEVLAMIDEGLTDISFSRPSSDIPWGVPVPGDNKQTMYVWCDALSNYLSAIGYGHSGKDAEKLMLYWPADLQIIGKDILRFHAIIWPGMLLAAGLPLPKVLIAHGHILSGAKKMSKTIGNVVDPNAVIAQYGAEILRNYLISEIPNFDDGDFTMTRFAEVYEAKFANSIGNIVSRIAAMIEKYAPEGIVRPDRAVLQTYRLRRFVPASAKEELVEVKGEDVELYVSQLAMEEYGKFMDAYHIGDAARVGWRLLEQCDAYIQEYQPFKLAATDINGTKAILWNSTLLLLGAMKMLRPIMPGTADKVFGVFHVSPDTACEDWKEIHASRVTPLFPRKEAKK